MKEKHRLYPKVPMLLSSVFGGWKEENKYRGIISLVAREKTGAAIKGKKGVRVFPPSSYACNGIARSRKSSQLCLKYNTFSPLLYLRISSGLYIGYIGNDANTARIASKE